jgi:hypothetical protein
VTVTSASRAAVAGVNFVNDVISFSEDIMAVCEVSAFDVTVKDRPFAVVAIPAVCAI